MHEEIDQKLRDFYGVSRADLGRGWLQEPSEHPRNSKAQALGKGAETPFSIIKLAMRKVSNGRFKFTGAVKTFSTASYARFLVQNTLSELL